MGAALVWGTCKTVASRLSRFSSVRRLDGVTWWAGLKEASRGTVSSPTRAAA